MFVMVWFYYISNIWKNQVFLKNRSPDFLLSPFFAQCECTVTRGTAAAKGKRAAAQESPLSHCAWRNASSPKGAPFMPSPLGNGDHACRARPVCGNAVQSPVLPRFVSRAQARKIFFHSYFLSFFICVQVLCICCASVVHEGGKKRRCAQYFRAFPVVQVLCSLGRSLCTVHRALCTKKSVAPPRRTGRAFTKEKDSPLEEII